MRSGLAFKKRYLVLLLIALAAFATYWVLQFSPLEQKIFKKVKVNNLTNLYITEASAGATTGFSYRYYLYDAKKSDADFVGNVDHETPFMITSDSSSKRRSGVFACSRRCLFIPEHQLSCQNSS